MSELYFSFLTLLERGSIMSLLALGVYLSYDVIKFENMSIEGAFGIGGATAVSLAAYGVHPFIVLVVSFLLGGITGMATSFLNEKINVAELISGIIISTGVFSVNLVVAGSYKAMPAFSFLPYFNSLGVYKVALLIPAIFIFLYIVDFFLKTECGVLLYAVGRNPLLLLQIGKSPYLYRTLGLFISNGMSALSHALFVYYNGYFSIWFSVGMLLIGISTVLLASFIKGSLPVMLFFGSILYQAVLFFSYEINVPVSYHKLIIALLLALLFCIKKYFFSLDKGLS